MRVDRRLLNWGVFLVAVGAVPLAARGNLLPSGISWGDLWPLLLVGAGLGLLLRATPAAALGGVVIAATCGLILGGALAGPGVGGFASVSCGNSGRPFPTASGTFGAQAAAVELAPGCGTMAVTAGDASGWSVAGTSADGRAPSIDAGTDRLAVRGSGSDGLFGLFGGGGSLSVTLPTQPTIDLSTTIDAGRATVDLGAAHVTAFDLTVNAGQAIVDLGGSGGAHVSATVNAGSARITLPASVEGSATVNAGELRLCAPPGAAIRIETSGALGSYDLGGAGLVQSGSTWQTPGFDAAATRIDLSTTANAGRIALDPAEGCR